MKVIRPIVYVCLALSLAACGGGGNLSIGFPGETPNQTLELDFPPGQAVQHRLPFRISGGVPPYVSSIDGCPDWVTLFPDQGILAGTAPAGDHGRSFFCTYVVTDSPPFSDPQTKSYGLHLAVVSPVDLGKWRFRTRTVEPGGPCAPRIPGLEVPVAILPHAQGGEAGEDVYALIDFPEDHFLEFEPGTRRLTYTHPSADPIVGTPNTYRYLVANEPPVDADPEWWRENAHDSLCLDIQYNPGSSASCPEDPDATPPIEPDHFIHIQLQVRDDAYHNGTEFRCPDTTAPAPSSGAQSVSNPVHTALGPIHAWRAVDAAHSTVRDRVRGWSPGGPQSFAISPSVGFASLSGVSDGFDYTGSSQSLSAGAELGAGSWQAGLVAAFTRTDLRYRAEAGLSRLGYQAGEHDTEIFSVHPFAAWHAPSGGHLWASLGAGLGALRHRDDLGFPSWSSSDVRLRAYALGGSIPLADVLSGDLDAEAGIESFAFEIEGGGRISTSLPTLRGRDYRAGVAWSAPLRGAPFLSLAYRRLTGDGPEGAQVEAQGSVSAAGLLDPRLALTANAEASFGLGDYEQDSWRLGGGVHFAPGEGGRGFGLDLDTRLMSPTAGRSAGIGLRGEAGYGLWSESLFGIVRPYVGLIRYSSDGFMRRAVGFSLRDKSTSRVKVEVYDQYRDPSPALKLTLRHRF